MRFRERKKKKSRHILQKWQWSVLVVQCIATGTKRKDGDVRPYHSKKMHSIIAAERMHQCTHIKLNGGCEHTVFCGSA